VTVAPELTRLVLGHRADFGWSRVHEGQRTHRVSRIEAGKNNDRLIEAYQSPLSVILAGYTGRPPSARNPPQLSRGVIVSDRGAERMGSSPNAWAPASVQLCDLVRLRGWWQRRPTMNDVSHDDSSYCSSYRGFSTMSGPLSVICACNSKPSSPVSIAYPRSMPCFCGYQTDLV
jgi:hypothetical protein